MSLKEKRVEVLSDKEIIAEVDKILKYMNNKYNVFYKIDKEGYNKIIRNTFHEILDLKIKKGENISENLKEMFEKRCVAGLIERYSKNTKVFLEVLNSIINNYLEDTENYTKAREEFEIFYKKIGILRSLVNIDVCIDLLSNKRLYSIIKIITENEMSIIESGKYYSKYKDLDTDLIDAYCSVANIEIEFKELEINSSYSGDLVKSFVKSLPSKLLTRQEEVELFKQFHSSDKNISKKAREELIKYNGRFVVSIAQKYARYNGPVELMDIIQDGHEGLFKAIEKFNYKKGYKFSTYSKYWIEQSIRRKLNREERHIHIPTGKQEKINKMKRQIEALTNELNRTPSIKEIADSMNMTVEEVSHLQIIPQNISSLNEFVGGEDGDELGYFIPSEEASPAEEYDNIVLKNLLTEVLSSLTEREREVIKYRFGLYGANEVKNDANLTADGMTLDYVGKKLNITRERVRQIESKALEKLRKTDTLRKLSGYVNEPDMSHAKVLKKTKDMKKQL